jgi:uncharacterized protein YndB with AHSA1/START domain
MARPMSVSQSVVIAAPPQVVYAAVSDPTQTGRWSPENSGASLDVPGALDVGSTFVGRNHRRSFRWVTRCRVVAAVPGEHFAFRVEAIGVRKPRLAATIATWEYRLATAEGGTEVTETWHDGRRGWPDAVAAVFDKVATHSTFHQYNTANMRTTLDNLKATLEAS